jgi:hypothetical protein
MMADRDPPPQPKLITELKASAHLMLLDVGVFCIFHTPGGQVSDPHTGLPGVRLSLPPTPAQSGRMRISTFHEDGWIGGAEGAALVRIEGGPAQVLVTVYQAPDGAQEPPRLQVMRLTEEPQATQREPAAASHSSAPVPSQDTQAASSGPAEIVAHVYGRGDIGGKLGDWIGDRGSKRWIEGFAIAPVAGLDAGDIEYQAVLGRDWLSPWAEGGQFCGSRGMSLPILGLRARLRGTAAETHRLALAATFVDGSTSGPVEDGEPCQAGSFAPLEAFRVELRPRVASTAPAPRSARAARPRAKLAEPDAKPVRASRAKPPPAAKPKRR